ncbi:uncharacterized protein [Spinacia oleracea]|uniref:DUF4283 domain-containing protein n=1 Tax=Spinacia oleracea TaxID=3562 RepID=A0ABM3RI19_SPIOL|nr:uncharacterized protein LOC130469797 [Spinacia oleracea]
MGQRGRPRKNQKVQSTPTAPVVTSVPIDSQSDKTTPVNSPLVSNVSNGTINSTGSTTQHSESAILATARPTVAASRRLELREIPVPEEVVAVPTNSGHEGNRRATKGMKLSFIAPTIRNCNLTACLQVNEVASESAKWASSVILYVVGDQPTLKYINTFIEKNWNCVTQPEVLLHNDGYFVIRFGTLNERNEVLFLGPYTIANKPVIVKAWTSDFDFNSEILKVVPLWIQLPNFPLNCWGTDSLSRIGSALGTPLFADECTSKQSRISFARMLVEIDVTRPIMQKVMVQEPSGKLFE